MFRLPFQHGFSIQNKVQIECLGVMRDRHNFIGTEAGFRKIGWQIPYRVVPETVPPLAASLTIYTVFDFLTPRRILLHSDEFRHM